MFQKLISSLLFVLFFNGCDEPQLEREIIYVKNDYPKHRFLYDIKDYEITDFYIYDKKYYKVNKKQLKRASDTSVLLRKQNMFYRLQVQSYNKKFVFKERKK